MITCSSSFCKKPAQHFFYWKDHEVMKNGFFAYCEYCFNKFVGPYHDDLIFLSEAEYLAMKVIES